MQWGLFRVPQSERMVDMSFAPCGILRCVTRECYDQVPEQVTEYNATVAIIRPLHCHEVQGLFCVQLYTLYSRYKTHY